MGWLVMNHESADAEIILRKIFSKIFGIKKNVIIFAA
jgi:hypothetical protein